jgi:uncharacterized protein YukE
MAGPLFTGGSYSALEALMGDMTSLLQSLVWTGAGASTFEADIHTWIRQVNLQKGTLADLQSLLSQAATHYSSTEDVVTSSLRGV